MDQYIGTKVVLAEPLKRDEEDGYRVLYEDGYVSWSPRHAFEKAYRKLEDGLTFSQALEALKVGKKVRRAGWNGKGMHLAYMPGYPGGIPANGAAAKALAVPVGEVIHTRPYIAMKDAQGYLVTGWLASQTDMLAEDWELVD